MDKNELDRIAPKEESNQIWESEAASAYKPVKLFIQDLAQRHVPKDIIFEHTHFTTAMVGAEAPERPKPPFDIDREPPVMTTMMPGEEGGRPKPRIDTTLALVGSEAPERPKPPFDIDRERPVMTTMSEVGSEAPERPKPPNKRP